MLGQSLGSIIVAIECCCRRWPDFYFDTMGAAFAYPLIRILVAIRVMAYVHYPTISSVTTYKYINIDCIVIHTMLYYSLLYSLSLYMVM
jgi:hypothetical protein